MRSTSLQYAVERANACIFNIVFRVPSLDEVLNGTTQVDKFLMNLGAGPTSMAPYTFSDSGLDLAIVSLDQRDSAFAEELLSKSFQPVSLADLEDGSTAEGSDIYTVGYPAATGLIGQMNLPAAAGHWASSYVSQPVYAYGKVSMLHDALPFFWADMSIYPGNSGGPVVENDKLVGVVSAQPTIEVADIKDQQLAIGLARIPFGKIIKSGHIRTLLDTQRQKDSGRDFGSR